MAALHYDRFQLLAVATLNRLYKFSVISQLKIVQLAWAIHLHPV